MRFVGKLGFAEKKLILIETGERRIEREVNIKEKGELKCI